MNKRGNSYPSGVTTGHWMHSERAAPNRGGARGLSVLLLSKMCQNMLVCQWSRHPNVVSASIATVAAGEGISAISAATARAAARASLSLTRS